MAKYYVDFVGLNTFIYEPVGFDPDNQINSGHLNEAPEKERLSDGTTSMVLQNQRGLFVYNSGIMFTTGLKSYKNADFSHELPNTASFFSALMLQRNGPYGFPTWKQIRVGDNPLTRRQRKENIFTYVVEPGEEKEVIINGHITNVHDKYGAIKRFDETPVTSKFKPFELHYKYANEPDKNYVVKIPLGNQAQHFNNEELDTYYNFIDCELGDYGKIKELYMNGAMRTNRSPIDDVAFIRYREIIYPNSIYTYKNYTRQRTEFVFPWRDDRDDRNEIVECHFLADPDAFALNLRNMTQSMWPMDVSTDWDTRLGYATPCLTPGCTFMRNAGYRGFSGMALIRDQTEERDFGILQNNYNRYNRHTSEAVNSGSIEPDDILRSAPLYYWHQMLVETSSMTSPNGMRIEGINTGSSFADLNDGQIPSGETKWEAYSTRQLHVPMSLPPSYQSETVTGPFAETYNDFVIDIRAKYKNYSIVPEFRMSQHVDELLTDGVSKDVLDIFKLTGSKASVNDSDDDNFYKIYTNSDFLKHFDIIREDHKDLLGAPVYSITCNAVKKFVPYDGFYPAQRTVDLSKQFFSSYNNHFSADSGSAYQTHNFASMNIITPLFAPGVLFNAIKSGIAVDYPLATGSTLSIANSNVTSSGDNYYLFKETSDDPINNDITPLFNKRVPFEALVRPKEYLSQLKLPCNVPHPNGNLSSSVFWDGEGDVKYQIMMHNFLSEVPEFFLRGREFSSIRSKPSNDPNFGVAEDTSTYLMRVQLRKSSEGVNSPSFSGSAFGAGNDFIAPQYTYLNDGGQFENFTMYSRPSAFGPPHVMKNDYGGFIGLVDSTNGENYPFTPPYYYGAAWADIVFSPTETRKYTAREIIQSSSIKYHRYADVTDIETLSKTRILESNSMQLDASLNLFGLGKVDEENLVTDSNEPNARWVIQTKFETPMLNFNHLSSTSSVTLPTNASQSVARGMWHQYGRIEKDSSKGVFMGVSDVPANWLLYSGLTSANYSVNAEGYVQENGTGKLVKSLADLVGFDTGERRIGQVATFKEISEAIVAVPFLDVNGERNFFKFGDIEDDQENREKYRTIVSMMNRFVFPPSMDFRPHPDGEGATLTGVQPFKMLVFEFTHKFDHNDLADMWQNLPPKLNRKFESESVTIVDDLDFGSEPKDKIKWMIFKVKQRANSNYFSKIIGETGRNSQLGSDLGTSPGQISPGQNVIIEGTDLAVSYNWPYDFFSMVELVNVEVSAKMQNPNYNEPLLERMNEPVGDIGQPPGSALGALGNGATGVETNSGAADNPLQLRLSLARPANTKLYLQRYNNTRNVTTNYYMPEGMVIGRDTFTPFLEEVTGDQRIELRREYLPAYGSTFVYFRYDNTEVKTLNGDQT